MEAIKHAAKKVGGAALKVVRTPWIVFAFIATAFFLVSAISWIASPFRGIAYVLFFPDAKTKALEGELRYLKGIGMDEEGAAELVAELLLGPRETRHLPLVTQGTRLKAVMLRSGTLFVDISGDVLLSPYHSWKLVEASIHRTVRHNLPFVKEVVFSIDGYVPEDKPKEE